MQNKKSRRLLFIDGLRGIAACMVMFYHLGNRTGLRPVSRFGYLGVGIFFVISGFVITSTLLNREITIGTVGRFFGRRFVRLDIPYWVNIAVTAFLGIALYRFGAPVHRYTDGQIAVNAIYLQGILGVQPINQVYWTLCLEIQFYLTLVMGLWTARKLRVDLSSPWFQGVFLVGLLASLLAGAHLLPSPRGAMFPYWWAFALGALICWWRAGRLSWTVLAVAFILSAALPVTAQIPWRVTAVLVGALIVAAARMDTFGTWLRGPIAQFFGRISYSLYLFHALIGWEAQTFALRYMGQYAALVFGIAVSILTAWFAYVVVEKPAIILSHRIKLERRQPLVPNLADG